jgi:alpha-1,3-mannosyl-glycoprotein beta-1,2-N-acetylglucosaminyltransferase
LDWERTCVLLMLVVAWGWIMTTIGLVLYHGFYKDQHHHSVPMSPPNGVFGGADSAQEEIKAASAPGHLHSHESPLLIFTCKRDTYLRQTLDDILKHIPHATESGDSQGCLMGCPIVISQDGNNAAVAAVIQEYTDKFRLLKSVDVVHWQHPSAMLRGNMNPYQALAVHYGWALGRLFGETSAPPPQYPASANGKVPQRVVILEEDLHVAPDFFDYFSATATWLDTDPSLLAVSAFNDNGLAHHVKDATRVLRSDFFPGLGWMMTRKLWTDELQSKWPPGYWDDWLREPQQRKGRHILRPEVSRTFHFGTQGGASSNQFGGQLSSILLNSDPVDWTRVDLSYLRMDLFDRKYWNMIHASRHADSLDEALRVVASSDVQVDYQSLPEFQGMAEELGIMTDEKAGILRTSYKGIVEYRPVENGNMLFLSPPIQDLQKVRTS